MSFFYHEEPPNSTSKRCKFLTSTLKDAFSNCHTFGRGRFPSASPEEEDPAGDFDDEQEVVVSEIRSRVMEAKSRRSRDCLTMESFCWDFSPTTGELFTSPKKMPQKEDTDDEGREEFFSVGSRFSRCSSATTMEAFLSVKTNFSRCSSLNKLDIQDFQRRSSWSGFDFRRRSIIQELRHCKGWPFGLCRKALLLPPLPKSPSESWSWRKGGKIVRLH